MTKQVFSFFNHDLDLLETVIPLPPCESLAPPQMSKGGMDAEATVHWTFMSYQESNQQQPTGPSCQPCLHLCGSLSSLQIPKQSSNSPGLLLPQTERHGLGLGRSQHCASPIIAVAALFPCLHFSQCKKNHWIIPTVAFSLQPFFRWTSIRFPQNLGKRGRQAGASSRFVAQQIKLLTV